jgi:RimJ/RimL family protein N-acetyltransferase
MDIRNLTASDGESFLNLMLKLDVESEFMLYEQGERDTSPQEMAEQIRSVNNSGGVILGAVEGGSVLGFVSLSRGYANRIRHSGYVVMGVLHEASGKGLGLQLLKTLDCWAVEHDISKLELTVMVHNTRAYQLYLRNGYEVEGTKKRSVLVGGKFYDEYYMGKIL